MTQHDSGPTSGLEIYLVGGAVRDELMGLDAQDRDWVAVGATAEEMTARGFRPVGKQFPVFLHPSTHEEYALARAERKVAPGYRGFEFDTSREVSLEADLARRDLTINAIARTIDGRIIDPFGGRRDLEEKILRHVSPAFAEDPVRVLRVARFAARYAGTGFSVAAETEALMGSMVAAGEVDALVAERVWHELRRALGEPTPSAFLTTLRRCGALARVLPEVDALFGVPQSPRHHPEIDTGEHLLLVLDQGAAMGLDGQTMFACLTHDLGKALTPREEWPRHHGHERLGLEPLVALCERLNVPRVYRRLAARVCRHHLKVHRAFELKAATVLELIEQADGLRQPELFEKLLAACEADARGRAGRADHAYPQREYLSGARAAVAAVDARGFQTRGRSGPQIAEALRAARLKALREFLKRGPP